MTAILMSDDKKQQILDFRKVGFGVLPDGSIDIPEHIRKGYDSAISRLSADLYSKKIHFVFELIQNAEDNEYSKNLVRKLRFEFLDYDPTNTSGCDGCLAIFNNEKGFELENIKAISTIGDSTKANLKDLGYIGEKGIGFKSVFAVTPSPHIYSNGYQVCFKEKDAVTRLGYIIPYWVDEVPSIVSQNSVDFNTCILLPLKANLDGLKDQIETELMQLDSTLLLFLSKLHQISISFKKYSATHTKNASDEQVVLNSVVNNEHSSRIFNVFKKSVAVPNELDEEKRGGVVSREITLAFPLQNKNFNPILYAYLPTEMTTGLPFLINADFLLSTSRESLLLDKRWNNWMRDEVAEFASETLTLMLTQSKDIYHLSYIPVLSKCKSEFLKPLFVKCIENLKKEPILPTIDETMSAPNDCVVCATELTKILSELDSLKDAGGYVTQPQVQKYKEQVGQLISRKATLRFIAEYLKARQLSFRLRNVTWFYRLLKYVSSLKFSSTNPFVNIPLFLTDMGLRSSSEGLIFFRDSGGLTFPEVQLSGNAMDYAILHKDMQKLLVKDDALKVFLKDNFTIQDLNINTFLTDIALPVYSDVELKISERHIWTLTEFVFSNWDEIDEDTALKIGHQLPLKNDQGVFEHRYNEVQVVVPRINENAYIWQTVFDDKEQLEFTILSDEYHTLITKLDQSEQEEVYQYLDITCAPFPKVERLSRYEIANSSFLTESYKTYLNRVMDVKTTTEPSIPITLAPAVFRKKTKVINSQIQRTMLEWLEKIDLQNSASHSKFWNKNFVSFYYFNPKKIAVLSQLYFCVKDSKWIPTQNGEKRIDEVVLYSKGNSELYGNAINFIDKSFKFSDSLISKLEIPTEIDSDTVLKLLENLSSRNESMKVADITKIYDRLNELRQDLATLFHEKPLIYCPSGDQKWCVAKKAVWNSQKLIFNDLCHWLSDVYPSNRKEFWLKTIGTSENLEPKIFAEVWLNLQEEMSPPKDKERSVRERLEIIYDQIVSYLRYSNPDELDDWFSHLRANAKYFTQSYKWVGKHRLYVSDDKKLTDLFKKVGVEFFWRSRGKSHADFNVFYESFNLAVLSEKVKSVVKINESQLTLSKQPLLSIYTKKLLTNYYKQYLSKKGAVTDTWYLDQKLLKILIATEYALPSKIAVKHSLDGRFVEDKVNVWFESDSARLIYNNLEQDDEEIIDELAETISKLLVMKAFVEEEDHIRCLLNTQTKSRFEKHLAKKGWEKLLTEKETEAISDLIAVKKPVEEDLKNTTTNNSIKLIPPSEEVDEVTKKGLVQPVNDSPAKSGSLEKVGKDKPHKVTYPASSSRTSAQQHTSPSSNSGSRSSAKNEVNTSTATTGTKRPILSLNRNTALGSNGAMPTGIRAAQTTSGNVNEGSNSHLSRNENNAYQSEGYRLFSYVENNQSHERAERELRDDKYFGNKAELYVKEWLTSKGFEVDVLGGNTKGYDLEALDPETAEIIYIEVKGQRGRWNSTGVAMSAAQMEKCAEVGDNYWFVVVENMLTTPKLHKFVNPAKLIDRYYFDANWSKIADLSTAVIKPREIDIDDLIFDADCKEIYKNILSKNLKIPEIGYELSNDRFEVIAELEFAWPLQKVGVYVEEPDQIPMDWHLYSISKVLADFSILIKHPLNIKDELCSPR
jgi:hypothetical protein